MTSGPTIPHRTSAQIRQQCAVFLRRLASRKGISPLVGEQHLREEIRRREERDRFIEEGGRFLSRFQWEVFASPTFRYPVDEWVARSEVEEFVRGFGPGTYAAAAYEVGPAGRRIHAHVLLGGLRPHSGLWIKTLWKRGNIDWQQYDPRQGAAWYLMKQAHSVPDTLEIIGDPKVWHPRRRKRGRGRKQANA